jgi:hypothetical protein
VGGSRTNLVGGQGTLQNQNEAKTGLDYATSLAGIVELEFGEDKDGVMSGGIPGGHGPKENASQTGQSIYVALAIFDVVNLAKSFWSLGKALFMKGVEAIAERYAARQLAKEALGKVESKALKEVETKAIRDGLEKTTNENSYIGKNIVQWGAGRTAQDVQKTLKVYESLTEEGVKEMANKGLTKEWVIDQLNLYEKATIKGGDKLKNAQLLARKDLMKRILSLWQ